MANEFRNEYIRKLKEKFPNIDYDNFNFDNRFLGTRPQFLIPRTDLIPTQYINFLLPQIYINFDVEQCEGGS